MSYLGFPLADIKNVKNPKIFPGLKTAVIDGKKYFVVPIQRKQRKCFIDDLPLKHKNVVSLIEDYIDPPRWAIIPRCQINLATKIVKEIRYFNNPVQAEQYVCLQGENSLESFYVISRCYRDKDLAYLLPPSTSHSDGFWGTSSNLHISFNDMQHCKIMRYLNGTGIFVFSGFTRKEDDGDLESKAYYIGGWKLGKPHGLGVLRDENGTRYECIWNQSAPHKKAQMTYPNGDIYVGRLLGLGPHLKPHGKGTMVYANGQRYKGLWKNGQRDGLGAHTDVDGHQWEGQWKNDRKVSNPCCTVM